MKFNIIYSDPPWDYNNNLVSRSDMGEKPYPTLTLENLKSLDVSPVLENDCLLFQWTTFPKIKESISVLEAWGFRLVTVPFVWVKLNPKGRVENIPVEGRTLPDVLLHGGIYSGLGHYTNGNVEIVLLGKRGKGVPRASKSVKQVIFEEEFATETVISPRGNHSAKPVDVRTRIESLFGNNGKYLELFSRDKKRIDGVWTNIGNEVDGLDIRDALNLISSGEYNES